MDMFSIGSSISDAVRTYFRNSRGTGRTTMLLDTVEEGDMVVFDTGAELAHFNRLCKERNIDVLGVVVPCTKVELLRNHPRPVGRIIFDHSWVERYYLLQIEACGRVIENLKESYGRPRT